MRPGCERLVMIVEDDLHVRDALAEVLQDHEYRAVGAANGRDALARLRGNGLRPCVILLDVMMPVMDGWEFRTAQRSDPALATIPVVVLTAQGSTDDTCSIEADAFLSKPVQLEALLEAVRRFCPPEDAGREGAAPP